jgi:hypothetical protein
MSEVTDAVIIAVGILGILIPAMVALVIYLKQRSRKLVTYKLLTFERLVSVSNKLKGKVKIFYDTKEVEDVSLFKIEIANSGNKEILADDYVQPISVSFGQDSQILSYEIVEIKPQPFDISPNLNGNIITFSKTVINSGESVTLKALVSKPGMVYYIGGRIAGGKIEQYFPTTQKPNFWWNTGLIIAILAIIGMFGSLGLNQIVLAGFFGLLFFGVVAMVVLYVFAQFYVFIKSKVYSQKHSLNDNTT